MSNEVVSNMNISDVNVEVEAKFESSSYASVLSADVPCSKRLLEMLSLSWRDFPRVKIIQLILRNCDVFTLDDSELGCMDLVKHDIDTSDSPPIKKHFRIVPFCSLSRDYPDGQ